MPITPDSLRKALHKGGSKDFHLKGLENFASNLEKDFFSSLYVDKLLTEKNECLLTLELTCNLSLAGLLYHFRKGEWGLFEPHSSSLKNNLEYLVSKNEFSVDVEEFSVFLKNTTIVVNRLHSQSIPSQLQKIFSEIGRHYVHMNRKSGEMPYEIYVPVFDSSDEDEDYNEVNEDFVFTDKGEDEYYKYWGLYYESESDPLIFDLKNQLLLPGNLFVFP